MGKKVLVINTSLRSASNSETLAQAFASGAADSGNCVEVVSLRGKSIGFCRGCLACLKQKTCVQKDDAMEIVAKMHGAQVIAFSMGLLHIKTERFDTVSEKTVCCPSDPLKN